MPFLARNGFIRLNLLLLFQTHHRLSQRRLSSITSIYGLVEAPTSKQSGMWELCLNKYLIHGSRLRQLHSHFNRTFTRRGEKKRFGSWRRFAYLICNREEFLGGVIWWFIPLFEQNRKIEKSHSMVLMMSHGVHRLKEILSICMSDFRFLVLGWNISKA